MQTFQEFVLKLIGFWSNQECIWSQPYDANMGAGTFHPHTFLKGLGPEPWKTVYVQPCRRPLDGRYGESPYRLQHYYQLQVLLKPAPQNIIDIYLSSLKEVGISLTHNDINLLEDDWKGPTLGAWGLGWEVRANGQEVTQFTYFQQLGGMDLDVVCGEITYGLERLYMYAYGISNVFDIPYTNTKSYGDIYKENEVEFSKFNFLEAPLENLYSSFDFFEKESKELCKKKLPLPAYDYVLKSSHTFNLLDARGALSSSERQRYIARVRECARLCAATYISETKIKHGTSSDQKLEMPAQPVVKNATALVSKDLHVETYALEVGIEEIPPSFQKEANEFIKIKLKEFFDKLVQESISKNYQEWYINNLKKTHWKIIISNRRLGAVFFNLPSYEPDSTIEIKGPAKRIAIDLQGNLSKVGLGFCKKNNISNSETYWKQDETGEYLCFKIRKTGAFLPKVLGEFFLHNLKMIPCSLKMKWSQGGEENFVRPVRWIYSQYGSAHVQLNGFGIESNIFSYGHRTHSPNRFEIDNSNHYEDKLERLTLITDWSLRKESILKQLKEGCTHRNVEPLISDDFVDKINGISESPVVFFGNLDDKYLNLPIELVKSVLQEHMNCFTTLDLKNSNLSNVFAGVANGVCQDFDRMIKDVEKVVSGRLDDGLFYYKNDLEQPLSVLNDQLKLQIFQNGLGSLRDKTDRMLSLLGQLTPFFQVTPKDLLVAKEACQICKADLRTGCVQEFPDEMQGVMGSYLVRHQKYGKELGLDIDIAEALKEHYAPLTSKSVLPISAPGKILSLIDKLDTLSALIWRGEEAKSNKDPFGLRRLSISILRLLGADKQLSELIDIPVSSIIRNLKIVMANSGIQSNLAEVFEDTLSKFLLMRLKVYWKEIYETSIVDAFCSFDRDFSLPKIRNLIVAANDLYNNGQLLPLVHLYKRLHFMTQGHVSTQGVLDKLFEQDEERKLFEKIHDLSKALDSFAQSGCLDKYLRYLLDFTKPLEEFFDKVLVISDKKEIKDNRMALLLKVKYWFDKIGEFSLLQVPKK